MSNPSLSDVDQDDIDQMIKGIDEFDDKLFSKNRPKAIAIPNGGPIKDTDSKGNGKKVKFEEDSEAGVTESKLSLSPKDNLAKPKIKKEINFDNDDDILGSLESKTKTKITKNVIDEIFGSNEKTEKNSFMQDMFRGNNASTKSSNLESKDFVLDSKYKRPENDFTEPSSSARRRRGNPIIEPTSTSNEDTILSDNRQINTSVPKELLAQSNQSENPFPWMSGNNTSQGFHSGAGDKGDKGYNFKLPDKASHDIPQNSIQQQQQLQTALSLNNIDLKPKINQNQEPNTLQLLDIKHQEIFNKEIEMQSQLLEKRRAEHKSALETQRDQMSSQYEMLQIKQNQVVCWEYQYSIT